MTSFELRDEVALGSALIHAAELIATIERGEPYSPHDVAAFETAVDNKAVAAWLAKLKNQGLLPVPRGPLPLYDHE